MSIPNDTLESERLIADSPGISTVPNDQSWVLVHGAGNDVVNGYYQPDGTFEHGKKYVREAMWNGQLRKFYVLKVDMIESLAVCQWEIFHPVSGDEAPARSILPAPMLHFVDPDRFKLGRIRKYSKIIEDIETSPSWELRLHHALRKYIQTDSFETSPIDEIIKKVNLFERTTALELFLWKSATLVEAIPDSIRGYAEFKHWEKEG